jgi:23S rRNA (cytosine1962-C5)-methyltransferase
MDGPRDGYRLIDAGGGRRLERFGDRLVDRPAPGATGPVADPGAWAAAALRYERWSGWHAPGGALAPWPVAVHGLTLELRPTDTGQVGLFPEQLANLGWLTAQVRAAASEALPGAQDRPIVLNLFASTGLASLALVAAGGAVVHVDSSRPAVAWARHNAALSGLADQPIRWIVDDAGAFVARELRRGRRYDGIVLDPPSYGHGDRGRAWRLEDGLAGLLEACAALLSGPRAFCLVSAHAEGLTPAWLGRELARSARRPIARVQSGELAVTAQSGARLALGAVARLGGRTKP